MQRLKTILCALLLELFMRLSIESLTQQFRLVIMACHKMLSKLWTHIKEMRHAHFMAKRDFKIAQKLSTQFSDNKSSEITVIKENLWRTQRSYLKYSPECSQSKDPEWVPTQIHFEYSWHFSPFLLSFIKTILWILAFGGIVIGVYWLRVHYSGNEKRITEVTVSKQRIDDSQGRFLQGEMTIKKTLTSQ